MLFLYLFKLPPPISSFWIYGDFLLMDKILCKISGKAGESGVFLITHHPLSGGWLTHRWFRNQSTSSVSKPQLLRSRDLFLGGISKRSKRLKGDSLTAVFSRSETAWQKSWPVAKRWENFLVGLVSPKVYSPGSWTWQFASWKTYPKGKDIRISCRLPSGSWILRGELLLNFGWCTLPETNIAPENGRLED